MALPKIIADFETQLSTAIAVGSTTFSIASATDDDGVALPTGTYYFTIDGASSAKEYIAGTLTGTAVTSAVSVSRQGVETSGAARAHRVGATVVLTDFATYKKYIDDISISGATDASTTVKGIVEEATQAEVDAGTAIGGTTARLFINPSTHRGRNYNDYAADAGSTDAYAITITPAITAYAAGQEFTFKANTANTGAATLNVSGLGAKDIKKNYNTALATGDIVANQIVKVVYDGTNMQIASPLATATVASVVYNAGTTTKDLSDATAATTVIAHGLGVIPRKVRVRGAISATTIYTRSEGSFQNSNYIESDIYSDAAGNQTVGSSTSYILKLMGTAATNAFQTATVAVDATNITLTWTKTNSPTGTVTILWEAEGYTT